MRIIVLGLVAWALAAAAEAAPRNGTVPTAPWQRVQPAAPGFSDAKPWKPYKPYSEYGQGSNSLKPRQGPHYAPGYKPYTPPFRERPGYGGSGGTFDRDSGTF